MRLCLLFSTVAYLAPLCAQVSDISPRVGLIEVFGARKVAIAKILNAIGARPGDPLPPAESAEDRVNKLPGIVASRVEAVCCAASSKMILYVGVEERGAPHIEFHPAPTGDVKLPAELYDRYLSFLETLEASIRGHNADEDLTNGYSLVADPDGRLIQQAFIPEVEKNLPLIDQVLRQSADPEQRAAAAYLLQYGPRGSRPSKVISDALQYAIRDQEDIVRKNAARSLHALYVGGKLHPDQDIHLEATWFVELMNSVVWSDRRIATSALVDLTEDRNPETLALLRERALPSVIEMARWHNLDHALPAFLLAGRLAGLDENAIKSAWIKEDRESVLDEAQERRSKHSKAK